MLPLGDNWTSKPQTGNKMIEKKKPWNNNKKDLQCLISDKIDFSTESVTRDKDIFNAKSFS